MLDDQTETQLVPKLLLQVSFRELHNSLVSDPNDGGLKYTRDEVGKINISVQATSTPPGLTPLITTLPLAPVELTKIFFTNWR